MIRAAAIAAFAVAVGCGPSTKQTDGPTPDPAPVADAGATTEPTPARDGAPVADPAPDQRERCAAMVDHMADVGQSEVPEDRRDAFREKVAANRDRLIDQCAAGDLSDAEYDCVMAATTAAEMQRCAH